MTERRDERATNARIQESGAEAFNRLQSLVADDMAAVDQLIRNRMVSDSAPLIPQLAEHLIGAGGKRLRPILTLAAAQLCDYQGDHHRRLAATVEFIHTATLLHDDVVDESAQRRGRKAANILWGNKPSILVGDFLFSRSFQLMVETGSLRVLEILSNASAVIAEGEVLQLSTVSALSNDDRLYMQVIGAKTAALFEAEYEDTEDLAGGLELNEGDEEEETRGPVEKTQIKAVVVSDIDCLGDAFFEIRARGEQNVPNFSDLDFQNVAYVLNALDYLAGDERYIEIRKRSRPHRVLTKIEEATKQSREEFREVIDDARTEINDKKQAAEQEMNAQLDEIRNNPDLSGPEKARLLEQVGIRANRKFQRDVDRLDKQLNREITQTQRKLEKVVRGVQDQYKFYAVVLPPILPILLGILVYFHRQQAEREGVAKTRLKYNQKEAA